MAKRLLHCLKDRLGEIGLVVKIPHTRGKTERPREPLLYPDTGAGYYMRRIGGRLRSAGFGRRGAVVEIPPLYYSSPHRDP